MELNGLGQLNVSDTVKVYWTNRVAPEPTWENIAFFEPELALKRLSRQRDKPTSFLKCPATQDYLKNTYAILSPIDINVFTVRHPDGTCHTETDRYGNNFYNTYIVDRNHDHKTFSTFSLALGYLFYSDEPVTIELLPATIDAEYQLHNTRTLLGQFDISKWIRPVELSVEIIDDSKPVEFRRGAPLFYVKFRTENNNGKKVEIIRTDMSDALRKVNISCVTLKDVMPGLSMEENYKLASPFIERMKDKLFPKKKCPFSKFWKN